MDATSATVLARGLAFPEGPALLPDGTLVVTEIAAGRIAAIDLAGGGASVWAECGGGPNGCNVGPDGALYIANNGGASPGDVPSTQGVAKQARIGGCIQRVAGRGAAPEVVCAEASGQPLIAPNDLCFDDKGGFYFTDPIWNGTPSRVCYVSASGEATTAATGISFPNGLGVTDDGKYLVVCESLTGMMLSYKIEAPGVLVGPKPNGHIGRRSVPDGMCFDSLGRIIVAGHGGNRLFVLDGGDGRPIDVVTLPDAGPTNVCFGGPDFSTLYVTSSDVGEVLAIEWPVPGMKLFPDRR